MLLEVLNILRVVQILDRVVIVVIPGEPNWSATNSRLPRRTGWLHVLLPMVNLVLILVVPVMARPGTHIWEGLVLDVDEVHELIAGDKAVAIAVDQGHDMAAHDGLAVVGNMGIGWVHQTVGTLDLLGVPVAVAVEVVQREEGGGVELVEVVFLCRRRGRAG